MDELKEYGIPESEATSESDAEGLSPAGEELSAPFESGEAPADDEEMTADAEEMSEESGDAPSGTGAAEERHTGIKVVTEAVVHERKIPHSSEKSATFETAETLGREGTDSEFLAGGKPVIHYHLSDYDGPLDLLLQLIDAKKIDIEDIFISDVTRQYVEIITNIPKEEMDYEYAGEFIALAAKLVYLKSLCILPDDDDFESEFDFDPEAERQEFIKKVQAFRLMQQEAQKLRETETVNRFYRMPAYTEKDCRVVLTNFSLPKLVEAFARVMINAERREAAIIPKKVVKDRFSVADQMNHILELTRLNKAFPFVSLFEPDFDKSDIVTTFLAVLELLKYGKLHVEQEEMFGEIMIYAVEGAADTPVDFKEENDGKY